MLLQCSILDRKNKKYTGYDYLLLPVDAQTIDNEYATANQAFYDQSIVSFIGMSCYVVLLAYTKQFTFFSVQILHLMN